MRSLIRLLLVAMLVSMLVAPSTASTESAANDDGPPGAATIMKMNGAQLAEAVVRWGADDVDFTHKGVLFARLSFSPEHELDAFAQAVDGNALTTLIRLVASHTCAEQTGDEGVPDLSRVPSGVILQHALSCMGALAARGGARGPTIGIAGARLTERGALEATVSAMNDAGFEPTAACPAPWRIQAAGLHVIASLCFDTDASEAHEKRSRVASSVEACDAEATDGERPSDSEASSRRELAAAAGAIEATIRVLAAPGDLDMALRVDWMRLALLTLQRLLAGHDAGGAARRARAAAGHVIPAMVGALEKAFTEAMVQNTVRTLQILMHGQLDLEGNLKADPVLDGEWRSEVAKRPSLEAKMQEVL
jgi:hypothetical protein